jgi:hypothetical protein
MCSSLIYFLEQFKELYLHLPIYYKGFTDNTGDEHPDGRET